MSGLSDRARQLLELAAETEAPPPGTSDRLWASLEPKLGQPPSLPVEEGSGPVHPDGATSPWTWVAGAAVGTLAAAGALLLWSTTEPEQPTKDAPRPPVLRTEAREGRNVLEPVEVPRPVVPAPRPLHGSLAEGSETAAPVHRERRKPKPGATAPKNPESQVAETAPEPAGSTEPEATDPSNLLEEARLMRKVQAALKSEDWATAAASVERHAERFPRGALVEEREAACVLVACGRRAPDAAARLKAFRDSYPSSVHDERLTDACSE